MQKELTFVGIYVLSRDTSTAEEIKQFVDEFKKMYPQYIVEGPPDKVWENAECILKQLDDENLHLHEQKHDFILVVPSVIEILNENICPLMRPFSVVCLQKYTREEQAALTLKCWSWDKFLDFEFWDREKFLLREFIYIQLIA